MGNPTYPCNPTYPWAANWWFSRNLQLRTIERDEQIAYASLWDLDDASTTLSRNFLLSEDLFGDELIWCLNFGNMVEVRCRVGTREFP